MKRLICLAALLAPMTLLAGCWGGSAGHDSPEAAFQAMQDAIKADDWETAVESITPESQELMAGGMVLILGFATMFDEERAKETEALLKKYGLDAEDDGEETVHFDMNGGDQSAALRELAKPISDKPAFIAEAMAIVAKLGDESGESPFDWTAGTLEDLKIDGKSASAVVVSKIDGRPDREPIEFRKTDDGWLVHLAEDAFGMTASSGPSDFGPGDFGGMPGGFDEGAPAEPVEFQFPDRPVSGTIHGHAFQPTKFELNGGQLAFSQGEKFFPDFQFQVSLSMLMEQDQRVDGQTYEITNPNKFIKPHVSLNWMPPGKDFGESAFVDKYVFRVEFDERKGRSISGRIDFRSLEKDDDTKIAGTFTAEVAADLTRPPTKEDVPYILGRIELKEDGEFKLFAGILGVTKEGKRVGNGAGSTFNREEVNGGSAASLTFKPQISAIRSSAEQGFTFRHISLIAGSYLVYVQSNDKLADWRWVELEADGKVTLDLLTVDASRRGTLGVNFAGGKDGTAVLLVPLDENGKLPAAVNQLRIANRLKLVGKLAGGKAAFENLAAGRYRLQAANQTADVEIRAGETTNVTLQK